MTVINNSDFRRDDVDYLVMEIITVVIDDDICFLQIQLPFSV